MEVRFSPPNLKRIGYPKNTIYMKNIVYREQLEGKINFYIVRIQEGISLTWQEHRDLRHLKRELFYLDHKQRTDLKRASFRNIRDLNDRGVI